MSAVSLNTAAAKPPSQGIPFYSALPIEMVERCLAFLDATSVARTFTLSKGLKSEHISQRLFRKLFEANFPMMFEKTLKECIAKNLFWETAVDWKKYFVDCTKRNPTIRVAKYENIREQRALHYIDNVIYANGALFTRGLTYYGARFLERRNQANGSVEATILLNDTNESCELSISNASFHIAFVSTNTERYDPDAYEWRIVNLKNFTMTTFQRPEGHVLLHLNEDNALITHNQSTFQFWNVETCTPFNTITLEGRAWGSPAACQVGNDLIYVSWIGKEYCLTVVRFGEGTFLHQRSLKRLWELYSICIINRIVAYGTTCFVHASSHNKDRLFSKEPDLFFRFNPNTLELTLLFKRKVIDWSVKNDILVTFEALSNVETPEHQIIYTHLATGKEIVKIKCGDCDSRFGFSTNGVALINFTTIMYSPPELLAQPPIPFTKPATAVDKKANH